ncbi:MAG: Diaminopimelate decarboxylase [Candidatus Argoarchaeum ethanivorans]|uniref:Diaminopimelate decarboxylase n=1 Tax=Candidatus Argoarchaeum ethanivorans TaxID=2608793 RepID=A0A811TDJ4_9EURY|nr:MAG: Diaminopimelate decarboxylase [Candidatus Argoarchaeum ethanivorans]
MFKIDGHLEVYNHHLFVGGVDSLELIKEYGSPLFVINEQRIRDNYRRYQGAFPDADIYYAVKANSNFSILRILAREGAGADVFSEGELYLALLAGIRKDKILFNGNSKTDHELKYAVETGVKVSVDSVDELKTLAAFAKESGKTIPIAFRVNPDVSPKTHPKIATGLATSKFGIPLEKIIEAYDMAQKLDTIEPVGIHCHIGSQILETTPFVEMTNKMMDLVEQIDRLGIKFEFVDLGSGLGIPYKKDEPAPTPQDLADAILPVFNERANAMGLHPRIILEPGRYITADATVLLTTVNMVKEAHKNFVGVDAGFNLLVRPAMYDSYHHVLVANKADLNSERLYTIAGPVCESGDILASDRELPTVEKGDLIAVLDTGAYGFSMSSQYNGRPRAPEVLVTQRKTCIVRERENIDDLLVKQRLPPHLL